MRTSSNWRHGFGSIRHGEHRIAFTVNLVVHRQNIDHLEEMISALEALHPDRMEIAHAQYYGWALQNRSALLPTRAQLDRAVAVVAAAEERLRGKVRIDMVVPDYHARFPKACMGGWGRQLLLIDPAGRALPCHAAGVIPGLRFDNVREHTLDWIWQSSEAFQKFRGEDWMPEPCRSCDRRKEDFGGCRCQAFSLTGDASATDPVCELAPLHQSDCGCGARRCCCGFASRSPRSSVSRAAGEDGWVLELSDGSEVMSSMTFINGARFDALEIPLLNWTIAILPID